MTKVFGVGVNDSMSLVYWTNNGKLQQCPIYRCWKNMLQRCYSIAFHKYRPSYLGCTVAPEWLLFSNFKCWYLDNHIDNGCLDKDILDPGNKIYGPSTCCFVTASLNNLLTHSKSTVAECTGVSFHKLSNKYRASISISGQIIHLGLFDTLEHANKIYVLAKIDVIEQAALSETRIVVKEALLRHAQALKV